MIENKYISKFRKNQFMNNSDFELFYYSDTKFKTVEPHVHDFYEYYFPVSDGTSMEINHHIYPLSTRSVVLIPPMINHRAISNSFTSQYQRYVLWISKVYMQKLIQQSIDFSYLNQQAENGTYLFTYSEDEIYTLHTLILRFLHETNSTRFGHYTFQQIELNELLMTLARKDAEHSITAGHGKTQRNESEFIETLTSYIDRNLSSDLSLHALAAHFFVSEDYISHLFTARLHVSPHQYILSMRLAHARVVIINGRPIAHVYLDCGFKDYSSFYRAFKKAFGVTPRELQKVYFNDPQKNSISAILPF